MGRHFVTKVLSPNKGYSCCFRNWRAKSHCSKLHGYDLVFSVTLECEAHFLTEEGWVYDFGGFGELKEILDATFDHTLLVAQDDPQLDEITMLGGIGVADPVVMDSVGIEAFSVWLHDRMKEILNRSPRGKVVKIATCAVYENGSNIGGYQP